MRETVSKAELRDTAPDPAEDFEGFIEATADKVIRELDALQSTVGRRRMREVLILRAMGRLERAIEHEYPMFLRQRFAQNVVSTINAIGRWSEAEEWPDTHA